MKAEDLNSNKLDTEPHLVRKNKDLKLTSKHWWIVLKTHQEISLRNKKKIHEFILVLSRICYAKFFD